MDNVTRDISRSELIADISRPGSIWFAAVDPRSTAIDVNVIEGDIYRCTPIRIWVCVILKMEVVTGALAGIVGDAQELALSNIRSLNPQPRWNTILSQVKIKLVSS